MPEISSYPRIASFKNPQTGDNKELFIRAEHGSFASHAEAEAEAKKIADDAGQDAVIIQDDKGFHVYGVDEIHSLLPGGNFSGDVVREAPIIAFVATDPITGTENIIGQQSASSAPGDNSQPQAAANLPPTPLDRYAKQYSRQLDKLLGPEKTEVIEALNQRIRVLESAGIKLTIEMDDDVFEYKDKLEGFKNLLDYAANNVEALQERSIREIAIMDEYDGVFGTKVDVEYDKKSGTRRIEIGDDFLSDWGQSKELNHKDSTHKLSKELGTSLKPAEIEKRSQIFQQIRGNFSQHFDSINTLQQNSVQGKRPDPAPVLAEIESSLKEFESKILPEAKTFFDDLSVKQERQVSQKYLETFKHTVSSLQSQLDQLKVMIKDRKDKPKSSEAADQQQELEFNARLEKLKLLLIRGVKEVPDRNRNYLGSYVGGLGSTSKPSAGLEYSRAFGDAHETVASIQAGTSAPLKSSGMNNTDIMLGMGVSHTFHSRNKLLNGSTAGIGVGFGRETPFFIGASAGNNWYLNDYHGLKGEGSVVGGVNATIGTYNNIGASINVHKQFGDHVEFEGYGELSLWNQAAEVEGEFSWSKSKNVYLTAGVGTNKLAYAGIGFANKYELEVGLGGVSLGKDSNNLPGESGWEVGLRVIPLPLPYFRHNRVPGYQFGYGDNSTQYITPNGTFMTIKKDDKGDEYRQAYIPDPKATTKPQSIVYRQVKSKEELDNLDQAPKREITIGPLGYLNVTDNGESIIEDGLIKKQLTEAELGIITDQAGVLWFDRMHPESQNQALGVRREKMPLPLYRAVHY